MGPAGCNLLTLIHPSSKTNLTLFASAACWMLWKFNSEMEFNGHLLGSALGSGSTRGCEGKRRKQDFAGGSVAL